MPKEQIERRENFMQDKQMTGPESTAVRVALWRAMHVQVDPPPHVLEDEIGLKLADPDDHWRQRPDMDPKGTSFFPAAILARARFIEDLVVEQAGRGVSMYLTRDAIAATLRRVAALAPGSTLAMTFLLPLELMAPDVGPGFQMAEKGARASGTPFISFFAPPEMLTLARAAGFKEVQHVSAAILAERYFAGRTDGLRPPNNSEELLVATA
jgi:O-methyltransferase involved in polyketide biosynthesis